MTKSLSAITFSTLVLIIFSSLSGCSNQPKPGGNSTTVASEPTPDKAAIEAQLKAMEYDWPRILKERDGTAVRKLEADDIVILSPDGSEGSKEGDIKDIESGQMADDPQEVADVTVNVLNNDTAVVRSRTTVKGDNHVLSDGKCQTTIHEFRTVDTFVRRNGQWQIVATATVPVRNPGPAITPSASVSPANGSPTTRTSPINNGSPGKQTSPQ